MDIAQYDRFSRDLNLFFTLSTYPDIQMPTILLYTDLCLILTLVLTKNLQVAYVLSVSWRPSVFLTVSRDDSRVLNVIIPQTGLLCDTSQKKEATNQINTFAMKQKGRNAYL